MADFLAWLLAIGALCGAVISCGGESQTAEYASALGSVDDASLPVSWALAFTEYGALNIRIGNHGSFTCRTWSTTDGGGEETGDLEVLELATKKAVGTYDIEPPPPGSYLLSGGSGAAIYEVSTPSGSASELASAVQGYIRITYLGSERVAGTYAVTFEPSVRTSAAGMLSGTFDVPICQ